MPERDLAKDALAAYNKSRLRANRLEREWNTLGRPLTAIGSMGQQIAHPLLRELRAEEAHCSRLRKEAERFALGPVKMGRPPAAVAVPDELGQSPAAARRAALRDVSA